MDRLGLELQNKKIKPQIATLKEEVNRLDNTTSDFFNAIAATSHSFIAIVQDYKYVFINTHGANLLQCKGSEDILGKKLLDTIAPEFQITIINRLINTDVYSNPSVHLKFLRFDNTSFHINVNFIHFEHNGKPASLIMGLEVDPIIEKELTIKTPEELPLDILNSFNEVIAFYSPTHDVVWINESGRQQLDLHDDSYIGKSCHALWFNSKKPCPSCPMVNNKDKTTVRTITFEDRSIWRIRHTPLYNYSEQLIGYIEFRQNITEEVLKEKKQKQVAADALYINQKNSILSDIETVLNNTLSSKKFSSHRGDFKRIFDIIDSYKQLDKDWKMLIINFEEVHPGFFKKLTDTYPQLTPNDIKHCACIRLNFDTKEIARFFNIKASSVQISRVRLKKKMKLSDTVDLRNFLLNF